MKKQAATGTWKEYLQAFSEYLRRPKTIFDFKDRTKGLVLLITLIILLQKVVEFFCH